MSPIKYTNSMGFGSVVLIVFGSCFLTWTTKTEENTEFNNDGRDTRPATWKTRLCFLLVLFSHYFHFQRRNRRAGKPFANSHHSLLFPLPVFTPCIRLLSLPTSYDTSSIRALSDFGPIWPHVAMRILRRVWLHEMSGRLDGRTRGGDCWNGTAELMDISGWGSVSIGDEEGAHL